MGVQKDQCRTCTKKVKKTDEALQCDLCRVWKHITCAEVSPDHYQVIKVVKGVKWFCKDCSYSVDSLLLDTEVLARFEKRLNSIEEEANRKIQRLETELNGQKAKVTEIEAALGRTEERNNDSRNELTTYAAVTGKDVTDTKAMVERLEDTVRKLENRPRVETAPSTLHDGNVPFIDDDEERKRSVIIYNVEESHEEDIAARIEHDTTKIVEICKYLGNDEFNEYSMEKIIRLGAKEAGKTRPLKVCVDTMITKFKIIRNTHKLKDSEYDSISIQHDLTQEQRADIRKLVELAKKKELEDPSGNYIYRVRGPPGRKFIKRLQKPVVVAEAAQEETEEEED